MQSSKHGGLPQGEGDGDGARETLTVVGIARARKTVADICVILQELRSQVVPSVESLVAESIAPSSQRDSIHQPAHSPRAGHGTTGTWSVYKTHLRGRGKDYSRSAHTPEDTSGAGERGKEAVPLVAEGQVPNPGGQYPEPHAVEVRYPMLEPKEMD
jgi:hypothetical protein